MSPFDPPFSGFIQPPDVPPDPTGEDWRGEPGPLGPPGPPGPQGPPGSGDVSNSPVTATGSTTPRMLPDRFADWVNAKDFGATLDGVAFDNAAYNAARTAVGTDGSVYVPYGQQRLNIAPTGGPATQVLWRMDGTYIGTAGANPVLGIGTDVVENFFGGNKYFGRSNSFAAVGPVLRVDSTVNHAGGTPGAVISTLRVNTTTSSTAVETCFGISSVVTDSRAVGNAMALAAYTVRNTARPNNLSYGMNTYVTDTTGLASSAAGAGCGIEADIIANGLDNGGLAGPMGVPAGAGIRTVLQAVGDAYDDGLADCEIGWGVRVTPSQGKSNVTFKRMYSAMGRFSKAAFSTEFATPDSTSAHAILLADGHRIAFDTAGTRTLSYDTTVAPSRLSYKVGGTEVMSFRDSGNIHCDQVAIAGGDGVTPPVFIGPYTDGATPVDSIIVNHDYNTTGGANAIASSLAIASDVYGLPVYGVWPINVQLNLRNTGHNNAQNVGIASTVDRFSGATPGWVFFGQHNDYTGLPPVASSQTVAFEMDVKTNGPESGTGTMTYSPGSGSRCFYTLVNTSYNPPDWTANHAYAAGDVVSANPTGLYTYIAQNAGTSGSSQPTWPTSAGTVVDGGVTWAYGTTIATQVSRAISIGVDAATFGSSFGAGIHTPATYTNAILEFSYATLDTTTNPNAAAIRLGPNMPIDFSGGKSAATQNLHTLYFDAATSKLFYAVGGVNKFSIDANGNMRCAGTVTGSVTP